MDSILIKWITSGKEQIQFIKWLKCINAQHETVEGYQIRAMRVVSDSINLFMLPRRYKYSQGILLVCYTSLLKTTNKLLYKSVLCLIQEECFKRFAFTARCLIIYCFHQFSLKIILFVNYKTEPLIYGEQFVFIHHKFTTKQIYFILQGNIEEKMY